MAHADEPWLLSSALSSLAQCISGRRRLFILLLVIWLCAAALHLFGGEPRFLHPELTELVPPSWRASEQKPTPYLQDVFWFPPIKEDAIQEVCNRTEWNSDLIFTCNEAFGGVGNVRNAVLNCVRFAIAAGASLALPRIVARDPNNINNIKVGETRHFTYMFDQVHFLESLRLSCRQLRVVLSLEEGLPGTSHLGEYRRFTLEPHALGGWWTLGDGVNEPENWRLHFDAWLDGQRARVQDDTLQDSVIVDLRRSYMTWPIYADGQRFGDTFGDILQFDKPFRQLATKILEILSDRFFPGADIGQQVIPNAYFGTHMRTEKDAMEYWGLWKYGMYSNQMRAFLNQARRSNAQVIYVASGNRSEIERFARDAKSQRNLTVVDKFDLLEKVKYRDVLGWLRSLTWDQQALVDYLVLLRASDFAGVTYSSFSWNIALKRHLWAEPRDHHLHFGEEQQLVDNLSVIYGTHMAPDYEHSPTVMWP